MGVTIVTEAKKGKAGRPKADPNAPKETKLERFRRLAKQRVPRAVKAINGVANLSGSGYEYTPEQAAKIGSALDAAVSAMKRRFEGGKVQADSFEI